jgi:hypothetical protein
MVYGFAHYCLDSDILIILLMSIVVIWLTRAILYKGMWTGNNSPGEFRDHRPMASCSNLLLTCLDKNDAQK